MQFESEAMKRWKKIVLVLVAVLLFSQLPFAYRRYRLGQLHAMIQQLNSARAIDESQNRFTDYKGVIHVHSNLGGHSTGTFDEMVRAAQANHLDFVVMTEHPSEFFDTAEMTLKGAHGGVLFVGGNEVSAANGDRLLLV